MRALGHFGGVKGPLLHLDSGHSDTTVFVQLAGLHALRVDFTKCKLHLNLELKKKKSSREKVLLFQNKTWKIPD